MCDNYSKELMSLLPLYITLQDFATCCNHVYSVYLVFRPHQFAWLLANLGSA